jgi:hypothetical protein
MEEVTSKPTRGVAGPTLARSLRHLHPRGLFGLRREALLRVGTTSSEDIVVPVEWRFRAKGALRTASLRSSTLV